MNLNKPYLILLICCITLMFSNPVVAQNGPWKINVKAVELTDFIEEVATITGRTFVVDPRIRGTVTVISDTQLDKRGVYSLLLSVLKTHEYSVIENGDVVEVLQSSRARMSSGARGTGNASTLGDLWVTRVVDVAHLDPSEIVKSLRLLAPQHAQFSAYPEGNVVVITDRKANIEGMVQIIEHLKSSALQKTVIVNLEHIPVRDAVELVEKLHETQDSSLKLIGNDKTNSLLLRGNEESILQLIQSLDLIDQPHATDYNTKIFTLGHSVAAEVYKVVSEIVVDNQSQGTGSQPIASSSSEDAIITVDESLNAVIVKANSTIMREVEALIEELDQRRPQVLIESAIVEVALADIESLGVELGAADTGGESLPVVSTSLNGVLGSLVARLDEISTDGNFDSTQILSGLTSPSLAIAQLDPDGLSFGAIINALTTLSYMKVLSTPSVLALNNKQSVINVGQNVPFRSASLVFPNEQSIAGLRPTDRNDIGTSLTVTPSIHNDLSVRMEILQKIEGIAETDLGIGDTGFADIVTNVRTIETTVVAENRQTIVMGGLIRDQVRRTGRQVPGLGRIPVLGRLFSSSRHTNERTMLIVFLRPTVLTSPDEVTKVTEREYQEFWEVTLDGDEEEPTPIEELFQGRQD